MAVTEQSYTGNGSTTNYSFTFPYLKSTDIQVQVDAAVTTAWSLANATTVQFNSAPANGAAIKILRDTNVDNLTATFYAGSSIKSEDLNDNFTQNLYVTQEVGNRSFENTGLSTMIGNLTMGEDTKIVFEGATDNAHETTLTVVDPTADRTITLPNVTGTVVTTGDTATVTATMMAANSVDSSELIDGSVDLSHMSANSVDSDQYVDGSIDHVHLANDVIDGDNIQDDAINSEHYVDESIDSQHIGNLQVTNAKIANDAVNASKIADDSIDSEHYVNESIDSQHIGNLQVTNGKIANDAVNASKIADDSIDSEHYVNGSIDAQHIADNNITTAKIADANVTLAKLASNSVDSSKIVNDSIVDADVNSSAAIAQSKIALDADLTALSSMQTGAAAKVALLTADEVEKIDGLTSSTTELNKLDGVTASATDLNIVASMTKQTTISDTDSSYPTSGAVVDYVASALQPFGGFEAVADEDNFPATQPASGVVISINDAAGVVINGSGVSTTARTAGNGSDNVTINGFPSSLYNETLAAGVGLQVSSTGSSNTYTYHKILASETDVKQLSDDINDFNSRYRIASSAPGSNNDEGDLYFDTGSNKMFVYDGSSWGEVTSTGDFKYLVLTETGTTNAASYDGSKVSFDLKENTTGGSAANVTNAAQLMVSINGVVQKPNSGTNTSGLDGFVMSDTDTIKFTAGVPANASVFVIQSGSALAINVTGDNTVSEAKLNVSNNPTNGYYLQAQSGNTGGLTWAAVAQYSTPLTTRGDILFRDASGDQRLAKGTNGQYLKIGANDPEWADVVAATADGCLWENNQTISNNYTIASGKGAHCVGPMTVNATVTVNGVWVVS